AIWTCLNNGLGMFYGTNTYGNTWQAHFEDDDNSQWTVDINGDGLCDFQYITAGFLYSDMWNELQFPDLLESVVTGFGGKTVVTYTPMTDEAVYQKGTQTPLVNGVDAQSLFVYSELYPYPQVSQDNGMYLVSAIEEKNTRRGKYDYKYSYTYSGAIINMLGWGWLGFESMSTLDEQTGRKRTNYFRPEFPYDGLVQETAVTVDKKYASDPLAHNGDTLETQRYIYDCANSISAGDCSAETDVYLPQKLSARTGFYTYGHRDFYIGSTYTYDQYANITTQSYLGRVDEGLNDLDPSDNVITTQTWDNDGGNWLLGFLKTVVVSSRPVNTYFDCGTVPTFDEDRDYSYQSISYSPEKHVLSHCQLDNSARLWRTSGYAYDDFGNLTQMTDPAGHATRIAYDSWYKTYPDSVTSPANQQGTHLVRHFAYDPRFGTQAGRTDFNGNVFLHYVDLFGRPDSTQGPNPDPSNIVASSNSMWQVPLTGSHTNEFIHANVVTLTQQSTLQSSNGDTWKEEGQLLKWPKQGEAKEWGWQRSYIDGLGRTYQTSMPSKEPLPIMTFTNYDSHGQVVAQSYPSYNYPNSSWLIPTLPRIWREIDYDIYDRPTEITEPYGTDVTSKSVTKFQYPAADHIHTSFAFGTPDTWQLQQQMEILNGQMKTKDQYIISEDTARTAFVHDALGRETSVTDPPTTTSPSGVTRTTTWDFMNRIVDISNPESGHYQFTYASNGRIGTLVDPEGKSSSFEYDGLLRKVSRQFPDGVTEQFVYDHPGQNGMGKLYTATVNYATGGPLQTSGYQYGYDAYGNQSAYDVTLTPNGQASSIYRTQRSFDPGKRLIALTNPDGSQMTADFGLYCNSISFEGDTVMKYSNYDVFGNAIALNYRNGVTETRKYAWARQDRRRWSCWLPSNVPAPRWYNASNNPCSENRPVRWIAGRKPFSCGSAGHIRSCH
ncbi:MAG: hypothetical protein AAF570_08705, partial [Bacteroidota bacterium]